MLEKFDNSAEIAAMKTWILSDGKAGHLNQSIGIAQELGIKNYEIITLEKRKFGSLLRIFSPTLKVKNLPKAPFPELVIGTGNLISPINAWIKEQNPDTFSVQMMTPLNRFGLNFRVGGILSHFFGASTKVFDVLAIPMHERPVDGENVIVTVGSPNKISEEFLKEAKNEWKNEFENLQSPKIAVLIGGKSSRFRFDLKEAHELADKIIEFAKKSKASLMITTSRRTGKTQEIIIRKAVEKYSQESSLESYFYSPSQSDDNNKENDKSQKNPFLGFLSCADGIIVTADSISMVSEACSTGKEVFVWGAETEINPNKKARYKFGKFAIFYKTLQSGGWIKSLEESEKLTIKNNDENNHALNDTAMVVGFIKAKLVMAKERNKEK